jgi:hypothetical protein
MQPGGWGWDRNIRPLAKFLINDHLIRKSAAVSAAPSRRHLVVLAVINTSPGHLAA